MGSEVEKEGSWSLSDFISQLKFVLGWYFKPRITMLITIPMFLWMAYYWVFNVIMILLLGLSLLLENLAFSGSWFIFTVLIITLALSSSMISGIPKIWVNTDMKKIHKILLTFGIFVGGTIALMALNYLRTYLQEIFL